MHWVRWYVSLTYDLALVIKIFTGEATYIVKLLYKIIIASAFNVVAFNDLESGKDASGLSETLID